MSAPKTMKAAMYHGAHDIRVEQIPIPEPKPDEVQIKVAWCGICGSDLHEYESGPILCPTTERPHVLTGSKLPICLGHEFSGTVTQVGEAVTRGWKVGDRVVVEPVISCRKCYSCEIHLNNACNTLGWLGLSGGGGGLSEFVCVNGNDVDIVHAIPDSITMKEGAMVEPLAVAMHAVQASKMVPGDSALVVGAGPIGCFVIKTLIAQGASCVIVSEPSTVRREMAKRAGAHHVFSPIVTNVIQECETLLAGKGEGVQVSFECAGVQKALDQALGALRTRGVCVNVAIWSTKPIIDMNQLLLKERTLTGVVCYKDNHRPAIEALASGKIKLDGFVTASISIDNVVKDGFEELVHHNEHHVKILVSATGAGEE